MLCRFSFTAPVTVRNRQHGHVLWALFCRGLQRLLFGKFAAQACGAQPYSRFEQVDCAGATIWLNLFRSREAGHIPSRIEWPTAFVLGSVGFRGSNPQESRGVAMMSFLIHTRLFQIGDALSQNLASKSGSTLNFVVLPSVAHLEAPLAHPCMTLRQF